MIGVLGFFDGLHLGHRKILEVAKKNRKKNEKIVVFTFYPHHFKKPPYINLFSEREKKLFSSGVDKVVRLNLKKYYRMEPEKFLNLFLSRYKVGKIVVGEDFRFGYKRKGNLKLLKKIAKEKNVKVYSVSLFKFKNRKVSSASLKDLLGRGNLQLFKYLTGYDYYFTGKIVKGRGIGKSKLFPTVNLKVDKKKFLPEGVFLVKLEGKYFGVADIGYSPTVKRLKRKIVEVYFLNKTRRLKKRILKVELLKFLRKEKKFSSLERLRETIREDIRKALIFIRKIDKK